MTDDESRAQAIGSTFAAHRQKCTSDDIADVVRYTRKFPTPVLIGACDTVKQDSERIWNITAAIIKECKSGNPQAQGDMFSGWIIPYVAGVKEEAVMRWKKPAWCDHKDKKEDRREAPAYSPTEVITIHQELGRPVPWYLASTSSLR